MRLSEVLTSVFQSDMNCDTDMSCDTDISCDEDSSREACKGLSKSLVSFSSQLLFSRSYVR